ncbi:MAG: thioredoxin family protein [Actinomycetota bacterium]
MIRLAVAAAVLLAVLGAWLLWRRPPRRLGRAELAGLGIRGPAIVQFTTRYCAPCKAAAPHLQAAADETGIPFRQIDVGQRPEVARRYGIRTVPTITVTGRGGRVVGIWTSLPANGEIGEAARRAGAGSSA